MLRRCSGHAQLPQVSTLSQSKREWHEASSRAVRSCAARDASLGPCETALSPTGCVDRVEVHRSPHASHLPQCRGHAGSRASKCCDATRSPPDVERLPRTSVPGRARVLCPEVEYRTYSSLNGAIHTHVLVPHDNHTAHPQLRAIARAVRKRALRLLCFRFTVDCAHDQE